MTRLNKILIGVGATLTSALLGWLLFLNHVDINEVGVAYDSSKGTITKQSPGWHVTPLWVRATTIPLIPMRVQFQTESRFILPKLVQFQPEYTEEFIRTEGFRYYGVNGLSYTFAQYAYSGKEWPFLKEIK
jgi:hypothetical protein